MGTAAVRDTADEKALPAAHRFTRGPHVMQAEHAGTIVLFDGRQYYTLPNETTCDLWLLLAEPRSADELVSRLHERYEAAREVIAADVAVQLLRLRQEGLVIETRPDGQRVLPRRRWWQVWKERG